MLGCIHAILYHKIGEDHRRESMDESLISSPALLAQPWKIPHT